MGRYTSVQTFTDQKTKVVTGYQEGGGAPKPARPEKVENVMGSTAGAGSCEFHLYRAARAREVMRLETMETEEKLAEEAAVFAAKVEKNRKEALERTQKNAEKRKRKRQKLKSKAKDSSGVSNADEASESEDEGAKKEQKTSEE